MKLKMFFLLTISFCFANTTFSQIYQNNQQGLKRSSLLNVQTEYFVSYRAYIETSAEIGIVPCGLLSVVPLGIQLNPSLFIGLGLSIPYLNDEHDNVLNYYTPYNHLEGDVQKNIKTTEESHLDGFPFFIELKYNLQNLSTKIPHLNIYKEEKVIPYISLSLGTSYGFFLPRAKIGTTFYNEKSKGRFSTFVGVSVLPGFSQYRISYDYYRNYNSTWYHDTSFEHTEYSIYSFSIGINYEFGGNAGFKSRTVK